MKNRASHTFLDWWVTACLGAVFSAALGAENAHAALDLSGIHIDTKQHSEAGVDHGWDFEIEVWGSGLTSGTVRVPGATTPQELVCESENCTLEDGPWPQLFYLRNSYPTGSYDFLLNGVLAGSLEYAPLAPNGLIEITYPSDWETIPGTPQTFTTTNGCSNCVGVVFIIFGLDSDFEAIYSTENPSTNSVDFGDFGIAEIPEGKYLFFAAGAMGPGYSTQEFGGDEFEYHANIQIGDEVTFFVPEPALPWLRLGALAPLALMRRRR